jgi:hypothetical protein
MGKATHNQLRIHFCNTVLNTLLFNFKSTYSPYSKCYLKSKNLTLIIKLDKRRQKPALALALTKKSSARALFLMIINFTFGIFFK